VIGYSSGWIAGTVPWRKESMIDSVSSDLRLLISSITLPTDKHDVAFMTYLHCDS
jgi:hypothetical protein